MGNEFIDSLKGHSVEELMSSAKFGGSSQVLRLLQGTTPAETQRNFRRFKTMLDRGAFDGLTLGGLRDQLFRRRDTILDKRVAVGDRGQPWNQASESAGGAFDGGSSGVFNPGDLRGAAVLGAGGGAGAAAAAAAAAWRRISSRGTSPARTGWLDSVLAPGQSVPRSVPSQLGRVPSVLRTVRPVVRRATGLRVPGAFAADSPILENARRSVRDFFSGGAGHLGRADGVPNLTQGRMSPADIERLFSGEHATARGAGVPRTRVPASGPVVTPAVPRQAPRPSALGRLMRSFPRMRSLLKYLKK